MDEKELIKKCAEGDTHAFEELIAPYQQGIINHAYMIFSNREDALDMAQEALVKAFVSISNFSGQSSFKTWLYKITTNVCLDEMRKRKRRIRTVSLVTGDDMPEELEIADESKNPEKIAQKNELRGAVMEAMSELEDEYRVVISLRELAGMDYGEIAKTLSLPLGTVKSRINRARKQLKEKLYEFKELL